MKYIPVRALYFNNKDFWNSTTSSWDYYIEEERAKTILEMTSTINESDVLQRIHNDEGHSDGLEYEDSPTAENTEEASILKEEIRVPVDSDLIGNFGDVWEKINRLSREDKVLLLEETRERLDNLATDKKAKKEDIAKALADAGRDSALVNRSALLEALRLGDEEAKRATQVIVDKTHAVIDSTTNLISEDILGDELLGTIIEKSNGTVVQHMIRVFLNGLSFLVFYNRLILTSSIVNRIRIDFEKKYKPFYRRLLPHISDDHLTLEHVFFGGMQAVSPEDIHNFASGFLVHDIGKAGDISYHEGDDDYNRETIVEHVKVGYKAVMNKTNYPREAGLITGYHHEYYGDSDGYGYFRAFLARYKRQNPKARQDYCIAYQMEPITDYQALGYFPAKMLEIVDIFDALTDPNRKYKEPMSSGEALAFIHEQFIVKKQKLDPILFDIFLRYEKEKLRQNNPN